MPPPTNTTPATATEYLLSELPVVTTQEVSDGATVQTVYYKLTNDLGRDAVIMLWLYGAIPGNVGIYYPEFNVFADLALTDGVLTSQVENCECQLSIEDGVEFWIRVENNGNDALASATLNINMSVKPFSETYSPGQLIIFGASVSGYYATKGIFTSVIDPDAGEIVNFIPFFPVTEYGDQLRTSGIFLINDRFGVTGTPPAQSWFQLLYDKDFNLITTLTLGGGNTNEPLIRTCNGTGKFWVINPNFGGTGNKYMSVTAAGVQGTLTALTDFPVIGTNLVSAHAASNDEAYLYLAPDARFSDNKIYKWNLATEDWDGSIGTHQDEYRPNDILVMDDDSIVIIYCHSDDTQVRILRYSSAGTLLNNYTIANPSPVTFQPRIGYSLDPLYFWLWMPHLDGSTILRKVKLSDGSYLIDTEVRNIFDSQIEQATPALIYASDTCPIIEMLAGAGPIPGLFKVVANKRNDTINNTGDPNTDSVKIPDPTFRTGLLP